MLTAANQLDHPLRAIARTTPDFLLHIARIVEVRGHGDEVGLRLAEAAEFKRIVEEDIRAVLAALD